MKKLFITILSVIMLVCFGLGLVACKNDEENSPVTLDAPTLTATGTELTWTKVQNASSYVLKINGTESSVNGLTYSLGEMEDGTYVCSVKAKGDGENYLDSVFSEVVTVEVGDNAPVIDSDAPAITVNNVSITVGANSDIVLNETSLGLTVTDQSAYTLSYSVKYNGEQNVTLTNSTFKTEDSGFYTVDVTATDSNDKASVKRVNLVVLGTYFYSLDSVTSIDSGADWFVRNSSLGESTPAEIVTETSGNKYYKFTAKAGEKTTFNMPLPTQNGTSITVGKSYKVFMSLWTDATLSGTDSVDFASVAPMINAVGKLDEDVKKVVLTADFIAEERLSTFYLTNNTANEISYYIDNIMLVEIPTYRGITVTSNATVAVDENDDIVLTNGDAWSTYRFALDELQNYNAGDTVKVTMRYKTVDAASANNQSWLFYGTGAGLTKGDLALVKDGENYTTATFNAMVYTGEGEYPNAESVIEGGLDKHIKITTLFTATGGVAVSDVKILIDSITAVKEVVASTGGGAVSTNAADDIVLTNSEDWSTYRFFLEELKDCLAGDTVKVTMRYKTVDATVANNQYRVIVGTGAGNTTEFFNVVKDGADYTEVEFNAMVYTSDREYPNGSGESGGSMTISGSLKPHLKVTTLFTSNISGVKATGVQILIDSIVVETGLNTKYGFTVREADLGLGGNTLYFLPSTTGMQSLSMVIQNTDGEIFILDGGYDSGVYGGNDAKLLYDLIVDLSGQNAKVVKGWFFTHPHVDHFGVFADFIGKYGSEVSIEKVYYSWAEEESWYKQFTDTPDVSIDNVLAFKNAIPTGTTVVEPKTGDVFEFGSFSFKILYSPANDNYNFTGNEAYNFNNLSLVIKMTTSEKSVLFLADAGVGAGEWLLENCSSSEIKADIVQMAHHGQAGVNEDVYQAIDPDVALWNCDKAVYENSSGRLQTLVVRGWMEKLATTNYVAKDGIFIFN